MAPTVMGGKARQANVYLDPRKLNAYNMSPVEVMRTLSQMNTFVPAGDVKIGDYDYQIVSNGLIDIANDPGGTLSQRSRTIRTTRRRWTSGRGNF